MSEQAVKQKHNRLINEKSPYLLQHAHNPVDWFPWCEEAFEKAKSENKPIFLSIGYSTCHWCHVMERESFEDDEVAELLNEHFVAIKVDKEERPDIDSVYMAVCMAFNKQGGWPLSVIMTPEQKPFFVGTYFPKHTKYGQTGIIELLNEVVKQWKNNKSKLKAAGDQVYEYLNIHQHKNRTPGEISTDILDKCRQMFSDGFDDEYGGFGDRPKFPTPHNIMFLLRYSYFNKDDYALEMAEKTLKQMYRGGIFDHIGFGFCRYSTDRYWLVPHFEKMLYDNALLTMAYLECYQLTKNELYKEVAIKTLKYVLRELKSPGGGFYCAQDADSEGVEGKYYVFTPDEIKKILGQRDAQNFCDYFGITKMGNFEGKSIPNLIDNESYEKEEDSLVDMISKVYDFRKNRTTLHKDDKILTSWNSLMICAFAKAYKIIGDEKYKETAQAALDFIEKNLTDKEDRLFVRYREGDMSVMGHLDDYAFYVWALIEMYEATFIPKYLEKALYFNGKMIKGFYDEENGGFYLYSEDAEKLIYRPKDLYDGAIPSGNSVASYCLLKLSKLSGNVKLSDIAEKQLKYIASNIKDYPAGYSFAMMALSLALYESKEVVCVLREREEVDKIKKIMGERFLPNVSLLIKNLEAGESLATIAEFTKEYGFKDDKSTFYICQNNMCSSPFNGYDHLKERL